MLYKFRSSPYWLSPTYKDASSSNRHRRFLLSYDIHEAGIILNLKEAKSHRSICPI